MHASIAENSGVVIMKVFSYHDFSHSSSGKLPSSIQFREDFASKVMLETDLSTLSRQALLNLRKLKDIKLLMMPHISDLHTPVIASDMLVRVSVGGKWKFPRHPPMLGREREFVPFFAAVVVIFIAWKLPLQNVCFLFW